MLGLGVFLLVIAGIVSMVGTVIFAVAAFRVSLVWGLLVVFVPFAGLVFLVKYWAQAKRGFLIGLAGSAVAVLGFFIFSAGVASKAQAHLGALATQMQSQMEAELARQKLAEAIPETGAPVAKELTVQETPAPDSQAPTRALAVRPTGDPKGLSALTPDLSDPGEIKPRDLSRHVGEELLFVEMDGGSVWGKLVSVSPKALRIERRLHGGSVQYDVPLTDIRTVRADG